MTVGIAAFGKVNETIVAACDRLLSWVDLSADNAAVKIMEIDKNWMCMFAAEDIAPVVPIYQRIQAKISSIDGGTLNAITKLVSDAYIDELKMARERAVLYQFGITMDGFAVASKDMAEYLAKHLIDEIEKVNFSVELLVFGHDKNRRPHIFSVSNPGIVNHHDTEGFYAIGIGSWAARSSLILTHDAAIKPKETVYEVCAAKFAAERTGLVGKETYLAILYRDGPQKLLTDDVIIKARAIWDRKQSLLHPSPEELDGIEAAIDRVPGL